jgi:hypothetical protein
MADHLPNAMNDDPIAVSVLADEMFKTAERQGIKADEINEEVDSVFQVIFEAMHHRKAISQRATKSFWICWRKGSRGRPDSRRVRLPN